MKKKEYYWIFLCAIVGLLFTVRSAQIALAQSRGELTREPRRSTTLITESPFITDDGNAIVTIKLVRDDGAAIADAPLLISGPHLPTTEIVTDRQGQAQWQLPPALLHGNYVLKVVFAGLPALKPTITILKISLTPAAAAFLEEGQQGEDKREREEDQRGEIESKVLTGQSLAFNAVPTHPAADRPPQPRPTMAPQRNTNFQRASTVPDGQPIEPTAHQPQPSKPMATAIIRTVASARQWLLQQRSALVENVQPFLATHLPMGQLPLLPIVPALPTLSLLALLGLLLPASYLTGRRFVGTQRQREGGAPRTQAHPADRSWHLPQPIWYGLRLLSVGFAIGLAVILFTRPAVGLPIFWHLLVPLLPLLFFVAPGLWRNICPMAALNQAPRLFHFTRSFSAPKWFQRYGYLIAIGLFLTFVASRKVIFNENGPALAILILGALSSAFIMGIVFKGKSGWCSSICPLLPVQRIYGQTPFVNVTHAHCKPCLGCTKNCYDLSPRNAYLADLYDEEPNFARFRKAFVGFFPGFIVAFYLVPNPPVIAIWRVYALLFVGGIMSMSLFFLLETVAKTLSNHVTSNQITVYFGAAALNLYYWFNAPTLGSLIAEPAPDWFVWPLRTLVFGLTLFWIYRTYRKEASFVEFSLAPVSIHGDQYAPIKLEMGVLATGKRGDDAQPSNAKPCLTIAPEGTMLTVDKNRTLLELCEAHNLPLEAGCRLGLCGADPVCVLNGMENLSKVSDEERKTLERLGLAPNTRLACMARVRGDVEVALSPEQPDIYRSSVITGFRYNKQIKRVVIIGNGIAGVTAADHIRRRHPHCEIHLIGRERYHLYNRMGITRLIYGRSAMQGLMLLPEQWYDDFNITSWLNTQVSQVDLETQSVTLGTGEILPYDRLILTTGSQSYVPPLEGFGMPGSFVLRTAEDAMAIRAYVQSNSCQHAVVAGGGLLGLEAAYALQKLGLQVTVLERSAALLSRQLDKQGSAYLLAHLRTLGIGIQLEAEASALGSGDEADRADQPACLRRLTLTDGRSLSCDLILVAAGIRPELALARSIGLEIQRGVVVDATMRTSNPQIFAAGDVAEYNGHLYGLWPISVSQAEVAAANAVADENLVAATYSEMAPVTMLKVVGIDLTSIGQIHAASSAETVIAQEDEAMHCYRKFVIADGVIVGAILLGYPELASGVTVAIKEAINIAPHLAALQAGEWTALEELA